LRNIALGQVRKAIEATFHYQKIRVRAVPPAVILEDVRTVSSSPFFSAEKIVIQISTRSLFRRDRPLRFVFDRPVVRLYARQDREPKRTASPDIRLPFAVESAHIRDGEVFYWGPGVSLLVKGVRAFFHRTGEAFLLRAECDEHDILLEDLAGRVMGRTSLMLEGRGDKLTLQRLTAQGPDYLLRARGVISNPRDPAFEIRGTVRGPVGLMADALDLPFRWDGAAEGSFRLNRQAGRTTIRGSFASDDLALNEMALGRTAANVDLPGDGTGRIDLQIRRRSGPTGYIDISFGAGRVQGEVRGVHLDPVLREVHVPWPVRSPAWGRFTLDGKALKVEGEFRDDLALEEPGRFPFRGRVALDWDGGRRVDFSSDGLESNFGSLSVGGGLVVGGDIGIDIRGDVSDVPRARDFVSRLLGGPLPIPEIRGRGTAEVRVQGRFDAPSVRIGFDLAPAGFDRFDTAAASGVVDAGSGGAAGWVRVRDPDFRSDIRFHAAAEEVGVSIDEAEGLIERLLPPLGVDLPLTGRASGRFEVRDRGRGLEVGGAFAARSLLLAGLNLREASGRLEYSEESQSVSLSDIAAELAGGRVEGGFGLGLASRDFSCDLAVGGLALENLAAKLRGSAGLRLRGRGHLDRDEIGGPFEVRGLGYAGTPPLEAAGTLSLDFRSGRIDVRAQGAFEPGRNDFELLFRFPEGEGSWFASAKGSLFNLDQLIPWPEAKAEIRYLAEARSGRGPLQLNGVVELAGSVFPIPGFAHALTDFSGLVTLQSGRATVRSLQAKLGGGDVFGSGEVRFGAGGLEEIDLRADGRDMALSLFERTRARADGSFRLVKDRKGFFLSGDVDVRQLAWRRDVAEKLEFAASPYPGSKRGPGFLDDLALDIRLRGEDNVVIDNSLGRIEGRFDLTIAGTVASPVILGDIEGLRGSVRFQDRNLRILRARLSFFNPVAAEPFLDFRGETYLKNYRVTFSLAGVPSKLRPEFSSSPPLPPEDVLALLALGESFKRTYSVDASAGVGTGALISGQLTDEAKKQAERLFRLDRFRIDPFVLGSSTDMTARLTVGKKISRDVIVLYSTNLTSQREEIVRLEWEISESFSLVAMRDEFGRLSVDAKIRRRF
ncbi:MAG: hypothetical protein FJY82_09165, partial [Candidatus Aminicenantes bacterium]|nr:hypothetical protein [Candidatus Aminicenantes bacterium]